VKENGNATGPVTRANGSAQKALKEEVEDDFEEENIFIFIPNIIGALHPPLHHPIPILIVVYRLRPHHPRPSIPLLHVPPPANLLPTVFDFLHPRRRRRPRSPTLQPIHDLWRRTRHGHRPLHHFLSACVPRLSIPPMVDSIPGADQLGSRESLCAYVCESDCGRGES
jgi:hypothetical protein